MQCPVVHCTWAFNHVKLTSFLEYFNSNVPKNASKLKELLIYSDNAEYRANAAFLLAHANIKAQELVKILKPAIEDPSSLVRNNSMRVMYYAVRENSNLGIPLDKVINVLDYPSFTDRNKALVVLRSLPKDRFSKEQINRIIPILLEILKKKDAHNYKNAHLVIKKISGKDFDDDDLTNWTNWSLDNINKNN
jgi:HEAT repeat protein